jgi:hypothetical protein
MCGEEIRIRHDASFKPSVNYAESKKGFNWTLQVPSRSWSDLDDGELASESGKLYLLISHKVCHTQYISHGMNKVVGGVV